MASSTEAVSTPAMADHPVRAALLLGAFGVVFCRHWHQADLCVSRGVEGRRWPFGRAVLGVISLVFWAIILVIAIVRQRAQDPRGRLVSAARRLYCAHSYAWRKGRRVAFEQRDQNAIDLTTFIASLDQPGAPERMNGTAVYLTKETHLVPAALELNVRQNGIVHKGVVLLKVTTEHSPRVDEGSRIKATSLSSGFRLLWLVFGFAEKQRSCRSSSAFRGLDAILTRLRFSSATSPLVLRRAAPFGMAAAALRIDDAKGVAAPDYFLIPSARVVELWTRVEM